MKTKEELLADYTKANDAQWRAHREMHAAKVQLDETVKDMTKELRKAVTKAIRGTGWRIETCKYWLGINHGQRPVVSLVTGSIELNLHSQETGLTTLKFSFPTTAEIKTLAEIRRVTSHLTTAKQ